jgi:hypothetical protein
MIVSISIFITGVLSGIFLSVVCLLFILSMGGNSTKPVGSPDKTCSPKSFFEQSQEGSSAENTSLVKTIIRCLDELNSPLKGFGNDLDRVRTKELEGVPLEDRMKKKISGTTILKYEKNLLDGMNELRDHTKHMKLISGFMFEMSKTFSVFAKDLLRVSGLAKGNMNKNQRLERKEEFVINNWWQALCTTLDYMANDTEELSRMLQDDLSNYSIQVQEELGVVDRRISADVTKQFGSIRDLLGAFDSVAKERDKHQERVRAATEFGSSVSADAYGKRLARLRESEDAMKLHEKKLYDGQREFYVAIPKLAVELQISTLKSIVDTHTQLNKLNEALLRYQERSCSVFQRMRSQLTNTALSLVQIVREENSTAAAAAAGALVSGGGAGVEELVFSSIFKHMGEAGLQGYETKLQVLLEALLTGSTTDPAVQGAPATAPSALNPAKLDMASEAAACLAATNPCLLPLLPDRFKSAISGETCVWFNAFGGRVYRGMPLVAQSFLLCVIYVACSAVSALLRSACLVGIMESLMYVSACALFLTSQSVTVSAF